MLRLFRRPRDMGRNLGFELHVTSLAGSDQAVTGREQSFYIPLITWPDALS